MWFWYNCGFWHRSRRPCMSPKHAASYWGCSLVAWAWTRRNDVYLSCLLGLGASAVTIENTQQPITFLLIIFDNCRVYGYQLCKCGPRAWCVVSSRYCAAAAAIVLWKPESIAVTFINHKLFCPPLTGSSGPLRPSLELLTAGENPNNPPSCDPPVFSRTRTRAEGLVADVWNMESAESV